MRNLGFFIQQVSVPCTLFNWLSLTGRTFPKHRNLSPLLPASVVAELRLEEAPFVDFLFSGLPEVWNTATFPL
jgi:hypothetical protein